VYKKVVGAFEVTVLQGGTAQEVSTWLTDNAYQTVAAAPTILEDYVAQNFVFVAIKLTGGAGVDEIHPLVFRYPGNEPCVPLKLTAVAAVEDMGVRTFFLGDDRVYPSPGYMHIELNPVRIDWQQSGSNYTQVVSRAADSAVANGKAFITEYAGASSRVSLGGVYDALWNDAPFTTTAPEDVVTLLQSQNLMSCYATSGLTASCQYNHPLIQPLLEQYLPAPAGVEESFFYANLVTYRLQIDRTVWSAAGFAADFKTRIVDPAVHARDLITRWPFLTRLFSTISPAEMTADPIFHARPDLSTTLDNTQQIATRRTTCSGQSGMILPGASGREVALTSSGTWPLFSSLMPWAEKIQEVPVSGDVVTLVDNTAQIDQQLALWNESQGWPPPGSGGTGALGAGGAGAFGSGGISTGGTMGGAAPAAGGDTTGSNGCACSVPTSANDSGALALMGLAFGAGLARRRRRSG
jgi:MYXO-CTERM domain-containing protein